MIRYANIKDIKMLQHMSKRVFFETKTWRHYEYDHDSVDLTIKSFIANNRIITDGKHCAMAFMIFPMFFNYNQNVCQELAIYIDENVSKMKRGLLTLRMIKGLEDVAKFNKCLHVIFSSIDRHKGDKVSKFYNKLGYENRENSYIRKVV